MTSRRPTFEVQWRLTWTAALATFTAALIISPTIQTGPWLGQCVVVILAVALTGGFLRQLRAPRALTLLSTFLVALLAVTVMFAGDAAVLGVLPGPGAWTLLQKLVREGADVVWAQAPPVPATSGSMLLVVAGVAIVAVFVDAIAVSWRQAALAGLPLLAVYLVPASVLPDGVPWPLFALSAIGWLALLLVESRDRLSRWGRTLALRSGATDEAVGFHGGATGRRLGAVAVVVAIALPLLLPALQGGIVGSGRSGVGPGSGVSTLQQVVTVNPIVDLRRDLRQGADVPVLAYTTTDPSPQYLRLATLDTFDGQSWIPAPAQAPVEQQARAGLPNPPGLVDAVSRTSVVTEISVQNMNDVRLPVPYPATQIEVTGDWRYDKQTLDVFTPTPSASTLGLDYQVTSLDLSPTSTQLRDAPPPGPEMAGLTAVPADVTVTLKPYVDRVTATAASPYDAAVAMQNWFRSSFTYSLDARAGNSLPALEAFLADRVGYCEQFAATMALMARVDGIPSRVVVGFTPGSRVKGQLGAWVVTTRDAHAWPELWFDGVGWVRFEPTPGGGDGSAAPAWAPPPLSGPGGADGPGTAPGVAKNRPENTRQVPDLLSGDQRAVRRGAAPGAALTGPSPSRSSTWLLAALVLAAVSGSLLAAPAVDRVRVRRSRRRAPGDAAVEAAWAELRDTMTDLDLHPLRQETMRDLSARLRRRGDLGVAERGAVARLAATVERLRYAPAPSAVPAAAWQDADAVTAALLRSASSRARRRARWWPQSSRDRLQALAGRTGQRIEDRVASARAWFVAQFTRRARTSTGSS